jgi:aldehyde:ferredoxin oxidoreductase
MIGGYMGKFLLVDLSTGETRVEEPDEKLYIDFIGGHGVGARYLYDHQKGGIDALGPDNHIGLVTGPLTGTPAPMGSRYMSVGKSPLTGTWGDANSGGFFGPELKFAGYDAVFVKGISDKPVYLFINSGKAELKDASHLWGKSTYDTEDMIQNEMGSAVKVVSIGPAAEKLSLISCLVTVRGAVAARCGLGAVMGSKKLKAVAVRGDQKVPVADMAAAEKARKEHLAGMQKLIEFLHKYGNAGGADRDAHSGDSPIKNWGGVGVIDLPDVSGITGDAIIANVERRVGCWRCPVACEARLKEGTGPYKYPENIRRPEYETIAAFGGMCLNSHTESILMANHICNSHGLDTISAGTTIAFAIECYENGIITKSDTDGIELTWGNHEAIVAMTEKLAKREGFGDILADGVRTAAKKIGKGAEQFAVHAGGQEIGMHDPKFANPFHKGQPAAARYKMDAAPGRHTAEFGPISFMWNVMNCAGVCMMGYMQENVSRFMKIVTGLDRSADELLVCGERIANMRHIFTLREGINPINNEMHPRVIGEPPLKEGPLAGVRVNLEGQVYWNLGFLDWDMDTTKPSKKKLLSLGLNDIAEELWPAEQKAEVGH